MVAIKLQAAITLVVAAAAVVQGHLQGRRLRVSSADTFVPAQEGHHELDRSFLRLPSRGPKHGVPSLAFIKPAKTGGSSFGGVLRRIGAKHGHAHVKDGRWLGSGARPTRNVSVWACRGSRILMEAPIEKYMINPYYITALRDPIARCMAGFYHYKVTQRGVNPDDEDAKLRYAAKECQNYQLGTVQQDVDQKPAEALHAYDFALITERFDESLLAMRRDLASRGFHVWMSDLFYLKARQSGQLTHDHSVNYTMAEHRKYSDEAPSTREALTFMMAESRDFKLVELANRRLDGFAIKPAELAAFRKKLHTVQHACGKFAGTDCFWNDHGCGQTCIDRIAASHKW